MLLYGEIHEYLSQTINEEDEQSNNVINECDTRDKDNYFSSTNDTQSEQSNRSNNEFHSPPISTSRPQLPPDSELSSDSGCNLRLEREANEGEVRQHEIENIDVIVATPQKNYTSVYNPKLSLMKKRQQNMTIL